MTMTIFGEVSAKVGETPIDETMVGDKFWGSS
jgi:hypothetical protein